MFFSGCTDRSGLSPKEFGMILIALPELAEAKEPFVFPVEGENHTECDFSNDPDLM